MQNVLDRTGVGRSTFYLHYRDKNDLLLSQLEMFLETMSTTLSVRKEQSHRVVPVAEMFAHIGSQNKIYRALGDAACTISSNLRKVILPGGLSGGSRSPDAYRVSRNRN